MSALQGILSSARLALRTTFLQRGHLPGSPWSAYLTPAGGIIVARSDNPDEPIPEDWRIVCKVNNARSDDQNMLAFEQAWEKLS